jgi:hypothetical protein
MSSPSIDSLIRRIRNLKIDLTPPSARNTSATSDTAATARVDTATTRKRMGDPISTINTRNLQRRRVNLTLKNADKAYKREQLERKLKALIKEKIKTYKEAITKLLENAETILDNAEGISVSRSITISKYKYNENDSSRSSDTKERITKLNNNFKNLNEKITLIKDLVKNISKSLEHASLNLNSLENLKQYEDLHEDVKTSKNKAENDIKKIKKCDKDVKTIDENMDSLLKKLSGTVDRSLRASRRTARPS